MENSPPWEYYVTNQTLYLSLGSEDFGGVFWFLSEHRWLQSAAFLPANYSRRRHWPWLSGQGEVVHLFNLAFSLYIFFIIYISPCFDITSTVKYCDTGFLLTQQFHYLSFEAFYKDVFLCIVIFLLKLMHFNRFLQLSALDCLIIFIISFLNNIP